MRPSGAAIGNIPLYLIYVVKFSWCQIVRGVNLSVFTHGVKLSAVSNCPGVKLSWNPSLRSSVQICVSSLQME